MYSTLQTVVQRTPRVFHYNTKHSHEPLRRIESCPRATGSHKNAQTATSKI